MIMRCSFSCENGFLGRNDFMCKFDEIPEGGVTSAQGFKAGAVAAGIKYQGRNDVAMLAADTRCAVAGMFTTN